mmetsp:Transcript_27396/g.26468  ORF Transcript_27396/g.26468 Transcript_27396/m.26468 type:complete len:108 (+) Transcript_27396:650-973(+)
MVVKGDFILSPNESLFDLEYKKERFLKEMAQNPQLKFDYEQQKSKNPNQDLLNIINFQPLQSNEDEKKKDEGGEKDLGYKCKIIEKVAYEKQKHIFPYRNWKALNIQ